MTEQWIFIEPNDVWMFRDNKPFAAATNFVARTTFPPSPQVIQGAIRSYSYLNGTPIGNADDMGGLSLMGPFVAHRGKDGKPIRYFPAPLDLFHHKDQELELELFAHGRLEPKADFETDHPLGTNWHPIAKPSGGAEGKGKGYQEAEGWLTEDQFRDYLQGKEVHGTLIKNDQVYQIENRMGLALEYKRRTHRESMLYNAEFARLCDGFGLLVCIKEAPHKIFEKTTGTILIGGESRFGEYTVVSAPKSAELRFDKPDKLKVVLLTPAYFSGGWQPTDGKWSQWVGGGTLVSAVIGKPEYLSGWDLQKNQPRPLRTFVPAGSVFYFEGAEWKGDAFTENATTDYDKMGFGTVALGTWS